MTLSELNLLADNEVRTALMPCCGSAKWVETMARRRPFENIDQLCSMAQEVWWALDRVDWLEAFSKHPEIGDKTLLSAWSSQEQNGMQYASSGVSDSIAQMNQAYRQKFGWIFIICATGQNAEQMRLALEQRLLNSSGDELRIAAAEQAKITRLRLQKLLGP